MINAIDVNFIFALCIAAVLGGILGFEREIHGRPAGLRTHLLVSLGSAAFMLLSPYVADMGKGLPTDPGRIAAQIVTGIGFLGAGAIVKEGISVRGLTLEPLNEGESDLPCISCGMDCPAKSSMVGAISTFSTKSESITPLLALGILGS